MPSTRSIVAALERSRLTYWEQPGAALQTAIESAEQARLLGETALHARALALQGAVLLHGGDLHGAFALAAEAGALAEDDLHATAEIAALNTHLHFFSGSYAESLRSAHQAIDLSDRAGDQNLRLHARRMACLAFGNVGVDDLRERFDHVLELARAARSPWEEGVARNDLAHLLMVGGDLAGAEEQLALAERLAAEVPPAHFLLGVVHATRSELRMAQDRPEDALDQAQAAVRHVVAAARDANPYLLAMSVLTEVHALLALGRVEDGRDAGERALEQLGDRVPQARSMILSAVAGALREAGRPEEAYDALARGAELEREAMREFSQLQLGLERARLEAAATRREADALGAKNRELEALVAELGEAQAQLEQRAEQLERLQEQLRDQADRDWLTGLGNRRFFARAVDTIAQAHSGPVSLAVIDLDHFKSVNDRFGHQVGDEVLKRVAELLLGHVRTQDVVVRTGGEEFAVLMPGAEPAEAAACCHRLRSVIGGAGWDDISPGIAVTASIGVGSTTECADVAALERLADERLYAAKRAGRDRVVHGLRPERAA